MAATGAVAAEAMAVVAREMAAEAMAVPKATAAAMRVASLAGVAVAPSGMEAAVKREAVALPGAGTRVAVQAVRGMQVEGPEAHAPRSTP